MREETVIHKAGGVIIRERSFLVVRARGKDIFVAPGGKLEFGETAAQALIRELMEETQIEVVEKNLEEVGVFTAKAALIKTHCHPRAGGDPVEKELMAKPKE
jgi:8-oxo-dGTP pyrophosphatase MutT (NUDIX family)